VPDVVAAYDAIAAAYDRQMQADEAVRQVLWRHYTRLFRPGMRVLDASCGTGIDAVFLASHGIKVVAIEISAGMVAELRRKVHLAGLAGGVETHVMDLAGLDSWLAASADGIISAFAGLNTIPDLTPFADNAARLLRPNGRMLVHMLNRCSSWDLLALLARGRLRAARRRAQQRQRTVVIGGRPVVHYLYSPEEAYRRWFAQRFRLVCAEGIGAIIPPPARWLPPLPRLFLGRLESRTRKPLRNWGRFFVLDLAKYTSTELR
jgi:ubiquinone/menaquinone biosynthesis C-methylase UbiE